MKVRVDIGICESNGICVGVAPEVFHLDADDQLSLIRENVTPDIEDRVRNAVDQCPRNAISLEE